MAGATDLERLRVIDRRPEYVDSWISRGRPFTKMATPHEPIKVRGMSVLMFYVPAGWEIDSYALDEDKFGQPIGPFKTLESAWLALQILKD